MKQGLARLNPLGYAKLTVSSTVVSLPNSAIPPGTIAFLMQCDGAAVRWRADGQDPVGGSEGMIARATDDSNQLYPFRPGTMRFVRDGATDGTLYFTFFGE